MVATALAVEVSVPLALAVRPIPEADSRPVVTPMLLAPPLVESLR